VYSFWVRINGKTLLERVCIRLTIHVMNMKEVQCMFMTTDIKRVIHF